MSWRSALLGVMAAGWVATGLGCASRRPPKATPEPQEGVLALYRGRLTEPEEKGRSFRVLVAVHPPRHLRAEVLPPVGSPLFIVELAADRLLVIVPGERTAYEGTDEGVGTLEALLGAPLSASDWLRLLQDGGVELEGVSTAREPAFGGGLPRRLTIRASGRTLTLERRSLRPLPPTADWESWGQTPPGLQLRPLQELPELAP